MMTLPQIEQSIREHPLFVGIKPEHLALILGHARQVEFGPGETLFREMAPANQLFLLTAGTVELSASNGPDREVSIQRLGPGEALGWSWLFPPFQWHFNAHAIDHVEAVSISGGHLLQTAEEHPDLGFELMKRISKIVIQRLQSTRKQLLDGE